MFTARNCFWGKLCGPCVIFVILPTFWYLILNCMRHISCSVHNYFNHLVDIKTQLENEVFDHSRNVYSFKTHNLCNWLKYIIWESFWRMMTSTGWMLISRFQKDVVSTFLITNQALCKFRLFLYKIGVVWMEGRGQETIYPSLLRILVLYTGIFNVLYIKNEIYHLFACR